MPRPSIQLASILTTALVVVSLSTAFAQTGGVSRGGALPGPLPLFPADNWWNADVSAAPVDVNSASYIGFIGSTRGLHPDLGGDTGMTSPDPVTYGMIYIVVPGSQPLRAVTFDYASESDYAAPGRPAGYPIPDQARTEQRWIEGGLAGDDPNSSGDRHMLIVDRDNRLLYELFALRWSSVRNRWEAGSGAIFPLDSNLRRPDGWTSADAAGLAILPGLVRYDEAYGADPIRHAFRVTVRATNGYVYPASHRAGNTAGALPMGARLRLKASKDLSGFPVPLQRIFQAMKVHGLIVADNGSDMYVSGTYDTRWDNNVLNPAFRSLKASDFEVVQLGWKPAAPPACTPVTLTMQPRDQLIAAGQSATLSVTAAGSSPVAYQWFIGPSGAAGTPVGGATSSALTVSPVATTRYWLRASNACGTANSVSAVVNVTRPQDFNGDGHVDLVWRHAQTGQNSIWLMTGASLTQGVMLPAVPPEWAIGAVSDFNGDGHPDLVWRNTATGENSIWLMNGLTLQTGVLLPAVGDPDWHLSGAGDFNNDGHPDLVWRNYRTGHNSLWLMTGTELSQGIYLPPVGDLNWRLRGAADFNADGSPDLVWRHSKNGMNSVWLMAGTSLSTGVLLPSVGDVNWDIGSAGDFDRDGDADLAWRNHTTGQNSIWIMNGTTLESGLLIAPVGDVSWRLAGPR
jgi:hypothetical protein